jgi:hypothetical protein
VQHSASGEPDEDSLRSCLLLLRPFISEHEPLHLNKIFNLCHRKLASQELKEKLIEAREDWKATLKGNGMSLQFNDQSVSPEHVVDLWINGWHFHNNEEKLRELRSLVNPAQVLVRHLFLRVLAGGAQVVLYVGNVVTVALKDGLVMP